MGAIVVVNEYDTSDRDSVEKDIFFIYLKDDIEYECSLCYWISDSYESEYYRLALDKHVLVVDNGKWKFKSPNYTKEVSEAFESLIKDIEERFQIRIPV